MRREKASSMFLLRLLARMTTPRRILRFSEAGTYLDIRVPIMRVLRLGSLAEKCIGFVKEKYRVATLGGAKDTIEIFLGLANVITDQTGEINLIEVKPEFASDHTGGHGLARARSPERSTLSPLPAAILFSNPHFEYTIWRC
jgi:hypothetical protein